MEQLRALFESLGLQQVETFIASGNVIFETASRSSDSLRKKIEQQLQKEFGYDVITFVRTDAEVANIAKHPAFPASDLSKPGTSLYIAFLAAAPPPDATAKLLSFHNEIDDFHVHRREVYWLCRKAFSESTFSGARLEKTLGLPATVRNATTVRKLAAKYPPR